MIHIILCVCVCVCVCFCVCTCVHPYGFSIAFCTQSITTALLCATQLTCGTPFWTSDCSTVYHLYPPPAVCFLPLCTPDQCVVTRSYLFLHKFWFFSTIYYFGNWVFIGVRDASSASVWCSVLKATARAHWPQDRLFPLGLNGESESHWKPSVWPPVRACRDVALTQISCFVNPR